MDPTIDSLRMQQIARCEIIYKNAMIIENWYLQDPQTLGWNITKNISYKLN